MIGKLIKTTILIFSIVTFMIGCTSNENNQDVNNNIDSNVEKEESYNELTTEEAESITRENLNKINENIDLKALFDESELTFIFDKVIHTDNFQEADLESIQPLVDRLYKNIDSFVTEDFSNEFSYNLFKEALMEYSFSNDTIPYLTEDDIHLRFNIEDQSSDELVISFIQRYLTMRYDDVATYTLEYKKIEDEWMLNDINLVNSRDKSLDMTFDDVVDYYDRLGEKENKEYNLELIDENYVHEDGEEYIVVNVDGVETLIHIKTSHSEVGVMNMSF